MVNVALKHRQLTIQLIIWRFEKEKLGMTSPLLWTFLNKKEQNRRGKSIPNKINIWYYMVEQLRRRALVQINRDPCCAGSLGPKLFRVNPGKSTFRNGDLYKYPHNHKSLLRHNIPAASNCVHCWTVEVNKKNTHLVVNQSILAPLNSCCTARNGDLEWIWGPNADPKKKRAWIPLYFVPFKT